MADVTAGRSAGSKFNATLDPMRPIVTDAAPGDSQAPSFGIRDVTAGRAAGTAWNTAQDPTLVALVNDPRR